MENVGFSDRKSVVNVLTQGRELANELKRKLRPNIISREACDVLVENVLSSYQNALTLLDLLGNGDSSQLSVGNLLESWNSIEGSPTSEGSQRNSKKRKTLPKWSEQVRVSTGAGYEGQFNDGHNWRKYGQKDILGANHPRAYYRCTHRHTQGCLATKQVQRADHDPSVFEVIYRGKHSCRQERLKQKREKKEEESPRCPQQLMIKSTEPGLNAQARELESKLENLPSFSFPTTPIESENVESLFFLEPNNFIGTSYSPPFLSPATSESYFSLSPCTMNDFGIGHSWQSSESDFAEIISNPSAVMNFPDLDIYIDEGSFSSDLLDVLGEF